MKNSEVIIKWYFESSRDGRAAKVLRFHLQSILKTYMKKRIKARKWTFKFSNKPIPLYKAQKVLNSLNHSAPPLCQREICIYP